VTVVAAVSLIMAICAFLTLLLVCSGSGIVFQEQLGRVNLLASSFASAHAQDSDVQGETESFVKSLMPQMGMTPVDVSVTVKPTQTQNGSVLRVTLANRFRLAIAHGVLPNEVTLTDSRMTGQ
jgi:hypothetical protein